MLRVTVDIFSGRPNPSWILDGEQATSVLRTVTSDRSLLGDSSAQTVGLGYRRIIIEILQSEVSLAHTLPSLLCVADRVAGDASRHIELARRIIATAPGEKPEQVALLLATKDLVPISLADELPPDTMLPSLTNYETEPFQPDQWNDPLHVRANNCYNYATNRRTDTFAQPGYLAGRLATSMSYEEIVEAAVGDGVVPAVSGLPTAQAPRSLIALFIWPAIDYHWYRLHSDGSWGHKPGPGLARTADNDGVAIRDPRVCSRAGYSEFCGFFVAPGTPPSG